MSAAGYFSQEKPSNPNKWVLQFHRWRSIAFTVTVIVTFIALACCLMSFSGATGDALSQSRSEHPPGKRTCPYSLHHAQEEMFVVLEGSGTLRVARELLPIEAGDTIFIPAGRKFLIRSS